MDVFEIGDIIMAKVGKTPLWPAIVTNDPESKNIFKEINNNSWLHVSFCNDGFRRAWLKKPQIFNFNTKENILRENPKIRVRLPKCRLKIKWGKAMDDAEYLAAMNNRDERIKAFKENNIPIKQDLIENSHQVNNSKKSKEQLPKNNSSEVIKASTSQNLTDDVSVEVKRKETIPTALNLHKSTKRMHQIKSVENCVSVKQYSKPNNMSSSLKRNLEQHPEALLINLMSGVKHEIRIIEEPFFIGSTRLSDLRIEEPFISPYHCLIDYTNANTFILDDHRNTSETYLNNKKVQKGTKVVLNHGDVIGFGRDSNTFKYMYKFVVKNDKRIKVSDSHTIENMMKNEIEKYRTTAESFASAGEKLLLENTKLVEKVNSKVTKCNTKLGQIAAKCIEMRETIKNKQNELKCEIISHLENNFKCSICHDLMFKATIGNCNHSFCESCITLWLRRNSLCPICRATLSSTTNYIAMDNFIKDLSELFGGSFKEQRDTQERENEEARALGSQHVIIVDLT